MKHLIIDTSYLIYRSYFAYPLLTSNGQNTGALYGFIKTVLSLIKEFEPDTLSFACDRPEKTWRHEVLPEYKAGRPEIESQMREQIPRILEWCELVTPNFFSVSGFEADDLIFTVCLKVNSEQLMLNNNDYNFLIFSSDKDLYQLLVQPNIQFVTQHKGRTSLFGLQEFQAKYELEPRQWVDFKALVGDTSDNLKGVSGIGPKTAIKILQEVDSLQLLFEVLEIESEITHLDGFTDEQKMRASMFASDPKNAKWVEKIKDSQTVIEQTYKLATLQNVLGIDLQEGPFDLVKGLDLVKEFSLTSLIRDIQKYAGLSMKPEPEPDDNALF